jgi:ABC-type multidrug transport system fused ATPase/permease subunit
MASKDLEAQDSDPSEEDFFAGVPSIRVPLLSDCAVPGDGEDIVQLSAPMFYVNENDGAVQISIIRLGSMHGEVSLELHTKDGSAQAGLSYQETKIKVVFAPGEHTQSVDIPILDDGEWKPSSEFFIELTAAKDCQLGLHLHKARVKILDADYFPSNEFKETLEDGDEDALSQIPMWRLFWTYLGFAFLSTGVKWQTVFCIVMDQLSNIFLYVTLCVGVYLVDTVFDRGKPLKVDTVFDPKKQSLLIRDRYPMAVACAIWYVIPAFFLFCWERYKVKMDIRGTIRRFLQKSMMRVYLTYTEASRTRVSPTDLDLAICESSEYVSNGYIAAISSVRSMGKIGAVMIFICSHHSEMYAIIDVALMPALLLAFTMCYVGPIQAAQKDVDQKLRVLNMLTDEACAKYRLIADYFKRYIMNDAFSKAVDEYTETVKTETATLLLNSYITKFLSGSFICSYIILRAQAVLDGELSLGIFLATITILGTYLADAITELNENLNCVIASFGSLRELTLFFSLPQDLSDLKDISELRRENTDRRRAELLRSQSQMPAESSHHADHIEIELRNVSFERNPVRPELVDVFAKVQQGSMVAIAGPPSSGKKTLLELMADILIPTMGAVLLPAHLRVLHVSREPIFLRLSMLHNITLGAPDHNRIDVDRIREIFELMKMSEFVEVDKLLDHNLSTMTSDAEPVGLTKGDKSPSGNFVVASSRSMSPMKQIKDFDELASLDHAVDNWLLKLSHTQKMKLHLCRALIANPNIMFLQRPLHHFSDSVAEEVLDVFREHLELRGLGYEEGTVQQRRLRTMFLIVENEVQANKADVVWTMSPETHSIVMAESGGKVNFETPRESPR